MFWYGHPLVAQGAGRIKTDGVNQQRVQTVLNRFQQWANQRGILKTFKYSITKEQVQKSRIAFPVAGFAFGLLASYTFVHPNSKYIGKFFTLLTTGIGYYVHLHYVQAFNVSRRFAQIQRMLDNNDSRYAFKWLKDDWKDLANKSVGGQQGEQNKQAAADEE